MSKVNKLKLAKKAAEKIVHGDRLTTYIPAGLASAQPPLGSQLGQRNLNIAAFIKDFNERTAHIKEGIPLPCRIKIKPDRSYELVIHQPPSTYYLKQAAGIQRGAINSKTEVAGMITLKHLYEIAKIKSQDPPLAMMSLKQITEMLVGTAKTIGIKIVRELDPDELGKFLEERAIIDAQQRAAIEEAKEAKKLRTV
ncbi:39S ribosomal protein L11, mitochondrial [Chelonus insularis]|uniref:39S ribosomal protein L11, mitochondrial n=1 Tax=Chelonus insularis TaxID=460826 RepID=UPI001588EB9C|nr:39S ribosomal protein L11, mitochondrial [Chelonus insularis]